MSEEGSSSLLYSFLYLIPVLILTCVLLCRNHWPQPWPKGNMLLFEATFRKHTEQDTFWGGHPEIQKILRTCLEVAESASSSTDKKTAHPPSLILHYHEKAKGGHKYQMIQFGPEKLLYKGLPMLTVTKWGHATDERSAKDFLLPASASQIRVLETDNEDIFRAMFEHLAATCRRIEGNCAQTKSNVYAGYLSPKKV